jgi:NADH-quinone oxidoreductase subunit L
MDFLNLIWLIPLFPAAGFVINGLFGKRMSKAAVGFIACGAVFISFVIAAGAVFQLLQLDPLQRAHTVKLYEWINAGPAHTSEGPLARFQVDWAFLLDPLSAVMVLVVTGIGFLIHIYSTGYMHDEDGFYRFRC